MFRNLNRTWGANRVLGTPHTGVVSSLIPADGDAGPSYLYNDAQQAEYAGKELCGRITTWPTAGVLSADENGAFSFSGAPDGVYTAQYELTVDGVVQSGTGVIVLEVGISSYTLAGVNSSQANASSTGALSMAYTLIAVDSTQNNTSGVGATTQVHILLASNCSQANVSESPSLSSGLGSLLQFFRRRLRR